jgi:plastocyanin domain-containing protein
MKSIAISCLIALLLIGGAVMLRKANDRSASQNASVDNVTVEDGVQIIEIGAKGGYSPRVTLAKADTPTVLRVMTSGTFDCSAALAIPSIGYQKNLPPSGITEIDLPAQKAGTKLQGLCVMGMYNFVVEFE